MMNLQQKRIGFALTGSFCTLADALQVMQALCEAGAQVYPIFSEHVWQWDTRFFAAQDLRNRVQALCGRDIIHTVVQAEPIGPRQLLDALVIAPCTGNTMAKLACGITDTAVTMAAKAHLRNGRPLLIAPSTNDGLAASAVNIGALLCRKYIYFVPFGQDDPLRKPTSLVSDFSRVTEAALAALEGHQLQPLLLQP